MGLFSRSDTESERVGVSLLIGEIRDLRSDMGKRDERVYDKIDSVEKTMSKLSDEVTRSQGDVSGIKSDVDRLTNSFESLDEKLGSVSEDVEALKTEKTIADNTWIGPKQARNTILFGGFLAAISAIAAFVWYMLPVLAAAP